MCSAEAVMAPGNAYGQYQQGKMNESYYNYLGDNTKQQSKIADETTSIQIGNIADDAGRQLADLRTDFNQTTASQKAAMAANGVLSDSATFNDVIGDTVDKQALDEAAVKFNADQAIWAARRSRINQRLGFATEETNYRIQGVNAKNLGKIQATNTLVSGAASGATAAAKMMAGAPG